MTFQGEVQNATLDLSHAVHMHLHFDDNIAKLVRRERGVELRALRGIQKDAIVVDVAVARSLALKVKPLIRKIP